MAPGYRWVIFAITFISYVSTHTCRQSFASAKDVMQSDWGFTKHFLGLMDAFFLASYALGLYSSGVMGDKFDTSQFHAFGLFITSFIYLLFAISVPFLKFNVDQYEPYYLGLWIINGLIQSIGWPTGVKLIGNWFTYSSPFERQSWFIFKGYDSIGLIFGIWAAHQYLGNIIGIAYVSLVEHYNWPIQYAFYLVAFQAFIAANLVLLLVKTYPSQILQNKILNANEHSINNPIAISAPDKNKNKNPNTQLLLSGNDEDSDENYNEIHKEKAEYEYGIESDSDESVPSIEYRISFKKALRLPNVLRYGIFFAMLKGVNYTIFFWFGYFGSAWDDLSNEASGNFLILFNVGSIIGGWICGYFTDRYKLLSKHGRSPIILLFLLLSIPSVFALYFKPSKYWFFYGLLCFAAGFFVGGPTNLISTVMATDIGKLQEIKGNPASFSTVSGIIDGTGSIGAAVSDYLAAWISDYGKSQYVYAMLAGELLIGAFLILPVVRSDLKGIMNRSQRNME
eukprot:254939_1